jgi:hypothetical protein
MPHALSISWHYLARSIHFWIYLLKYPLAFVAGWAGIHYQRWRKQRAETAAEGWPSANGRIVSGDFKEVPKTKRWLATLTYTYFVGEYRTGKYIHEFMSADEAGDFVRAMKDKNVQIRYKESNPDKSVLEQRVIEQYILLAPRFG